MKTKILGLATLSLLFVATSCKNETVESANDAKKVTFKTALGKQTVTRVGEFTYGSWEHDNAMTIRSFYNASMNEFNVFNLKFDTSGGGTGVWDYDGTVMSTGAYIRYYAWYPDTPENGAHTVNDYTFDYTVKDTDATQEDLIAAVAITNGNVVSLPFKHTLSQVNFGIVKTMGVGIEIQDIKINGVNSKGTYTFSTNSWGDLSISDQYEYNPYTDEDVDPKIYTNVTDGQSTGISYMGNGNGINTFDNALMLMPQQFTGTNGTLSFTFRLTTTDEEGDPVYTPSADMTPVTAYLSDFDTSTWLPGYRYLYLFDFSTYFKTGRISFTVSVDGWEDDEANTVAETLQVTDNTAEAIELAIAKHSAANSANNGLEIFPIAVSEEVTEAIVIKNIAGFESGDQIRIEFIDTISLNRASLDPSVAASWAITTSDNRVWILTKK